MKEGKILLSNEVRNSYSEVFELLKKTDREDIKNIPIEILETIKSNRNPEYIPEMDYNHIQNTLSKKAISLYTWLYIEYIAKSQEEKNSINKILYDNEIEKQKRWNMDSNMFQRKLQDREKVEDLQQDIQLMRYKETIWRRILNKIRTIFKRY